MNQFSQGKSLGSQDCQVSVDKDDPCKADAGTIFGRLRKAATRLQNAGEILETLNQRISPDPRQISGPSGPSGPSQGQPSLDDLAEMLVRLASEVAAEANTLAMKIGQ